jgi:Fe-S-cluster-containing dehydrogenase component
MSLDRRAFLTQSFGGAAAAGATVLAGDAQALTLARPTRELLPDAVGILYDSTVCIGCKMCVSACRAANGMQVSVRKPGDPEDLDGRTLTVIKTYANGTRKTKDSEIDGYAFLSGSACTASTRPASRSAPSAPCTRTR